jgi:hypothetical protein
MAIKKFSELSAAGTLDGTEVVALVKGGSTKRTTVAEIANRATALGNITTGIITPVTDGLYNLGSLALRWLGAFFSSGAVITWGNTDYTLTHSTGTLTASGALLSAGATSGVGYSAGAGGAVTQATSRTTGVTLNKMSGAITLFSAAGSTTAATFTVTNSAVAATDLVVINQKSGTDKYITKVTAVAAGSFNVTFFTTGGTTTEQPVFSFAVIKAVAA